MPVQTQVQGMARAALRLIGKHGRNWNVQEEAQEYVQEQKLRDLVSQYSEFINFPIYLYTSKQVRPISCTTA